MALETYFLGVLWVLCDGLASEETKKIKVKRQSKKKQAGFYKEVDELIDVPAIQVLDPAAGTGTFLRQTILQIYENFKAKHKGLHPDQLAAEWNKYVPEQLLPRLNGFELMMAPYAVAHMKLAMILKDTGYDFSGDTRLNVYLTNSLEEAGTSETQMTLFDDPLAWESVEANGVKKNLGINVVIGNPPYSGESANKGEYILGLMDDYKKEPGGLLKLQERNPKWINDDYVKFIRYAQEVIGKSQDGILAYICPHGFLDNPTFRGMRWWFTQTFRTTYIIDLHGNAKKKETAPDGSKDENVFDIQQGVCIVLGIHKGTRKSTPEVYHADLYGLRNRKYEWLNRHSLEDIAFERLLPESPQFFFVPKDLKTGEEYLSSDFFGIDELFNISLLELVNLGVGLFGLLGKDKQFIVFKGRNCRVIRKLRSEPIGNKLMGIGKRLGQSLNGFKDVQEIGGILVGFDVLFHVLIGHALILVGGSDFPASLNADSQIREVFRNALDQIVFGRAILLRGGVELVVHNQSVGSKVNPITGNLLSSSHNS